MQSTRFAREARTSGSSWDETVKDMKSGLVLKGRGVIEKNSSTCANDKRTII